MNSKNSEIRPFYYENLKDELEQHLSDMGNNISFVSNTWFLDKLIRSPGNTNTEYVFYFSSLPEKYQELGKYFMIMKYRGRKSINTMKKDLFGISVFFKYLAKECNSISLDKVNKTVILEYETYLKHLDRYTKGTKEGLFSAISNFFRTMTGWPEMPYKMPMGKGNPFNRTKAERRIAGKLIPEFITNQLDFIFKDERIPIYERVVYWLLRSIPSRVTEVCSMRLECLKPSYRSDNTWVIFIPTWKQSGGYREPELRAIHIKCEGHGKYLIDLIREQQGLSSEMQDKIPDNKKGMLFTYLPRDLNGWALKLEGRIEYKKEKANSEPIIANGCSVRTWFNTVCRIFNVIDKRNELYNFTSHQLRHNGITDRFYDGFSIIEIRDMTGHKGNEMLETSYIHENPEKLIEKQKMINEKIHKSNKETPILFNGRILNMDKGQEERLLRNSRANRLGRLGICSDITYCKGKVFECLDCKYHIPDADELDYFEEQVRIWSKKVETFKNHQYMRENAEYNLYLHQRVIDKIKNTVQVMGVECGV